MHSPTTLARLLVLLVVFQAHLVHRVEDAAVDRLEAVAHVGQRAPDDDRHRVVEIRPAHLVFDVDGDDAGGAGAGGRRGRRCHSATEGKLGILIVCHREGSGPAGATC